MRFLASRDGVEWEVEVRETEGGYRVRIGDRWHDVDAAVLEGSFLSLILGGRSYEVSVRRDSRDRYAVRRGGYLDLVRITDPLASTAGAKLASKGPTEVRATMPGRVVAELVKEDEEVGEGQGLIVLEAMKMENEIPAPRPGRVRRLAVRAGQTVESGDLIAVIE
ncbi:MAG: acetyl-CoA carboxylase biotin carboxyl carrier protein subunit [Acidobacteria bacterium]|nr:MAG: acetyl-CoA carboxylase biotin carboxyl carrier protein subunit [Acidobacteriota bacterium]